MHTFSHMEFQILKASNYIRKTTIKADQFITHTLSIWQKKPILSGVYASL